MTTTLVRLARVRPRSPGAWGLGGVAARAYGPQPQFSAMRALPLRLMFWLVLATGERRSDPEGTAVCCLSGASGRPKVLGALTTLAAAAVLVGLWATRSVSWPVWALLLAVCWWYRPVTRSGVVGMGARRALRRSRPAGRVVVVHTVASVERGAGRRLLARVMVEADQEGWVLVLDAANARLADYYRRFGFVESGPAVVMPWGEANVPMTRRPCPAVGSGGDG